MVDDGPRGPDAIADRPAASADLEAVCTLVESLTEGLLACVLVLSPDGAHLRCGAAPSLPPGYRRALDGLAIGPASGAEGAAAQRRALVVTADIATDPLWIGLREMAMANGLRACWAAPILSSGGDLLGTLGVYARSARSPSDAEMRLAERAAGLAAAALERERERAGRLAAEARLAGLLGVASDAIIVIDEHQRITLFNQGAERIFGYQAAELLGQPLDRLLPARYAVAHRKHVREFEAGPEDSRLMNRRGEIIGRRKNGDEFPAEASITKLRQQGRTTLTVILRDISDRKQAEEALRRSEARAQALVQSAVHGIFRSTPDGRLLEVNPALTRMLGYESEAALLAVTLPEIYVDLGQRREILEHFRRNDTNRGAEVAWRRRDGSTAIIRLSGRAVRDARGKIEYFEAFAEDVTEQRRLEAELRLAQKMEAIGRLAGGIAHDFNNLLTIVKGRAQLLLRRGGLDAQARRDVELIYAAAERTAALTAQLLAVGRRQVLRPRPLDLNAAVDHMATLLRRLIGEDVELIMRLGRDLWAIRADPAQIDQVLLNLALNARDAMPGGGRLTVTTANVELEEAFTQQHQGSQPGAHVLLEVADTGAGMDSDTLAQIFEPFFTTKPMAKGTGLGLSTVYGIVRQHGGIIAVQSAPGRGATFQIYFPRTTEAVAAGPAPEPAVALPHGSETILLVEDEADVRQLAREVLEGAGYTVIGAHDGAQALAEAAAHRGPIHLLVTDVVMPAMSGPELAGRLRAEHPELRVLFTTGYPDRVANHEDLVRGGAAFVAKPFSPETLTQGVRAALDAPAAGTG